MTEQNWTKNLELVKLVEELESLAEKFEVAGEHDIYLILNGLVIARVCDEDGESDLVNPFKSEAVKILNALQLNDENNYSIAEIL